MLIFNKHCAEDVRLIEVSLYVKKFNFLLTLSLCNDSFYSLTRFLVSSVINKYFKNHPRLKEHFSFFPTKIALIS